MTLKEIDAFYEPVHNVFRKFLHDKEKLKFVVSCIPYLQQYARYEAAIYYEYADDFEEIRRDLIEKYILVRRDYSVEEISWIVERCKHKC